MIPSSANKGLFLLAPLVLAFLAPTAWAVIPVDAAGYRRPQRRDLFTSPVSSLQVYGVIMAGWASNSK